MKNALKLGVLAGFATSLLACTKPTPVDDGLQKIQTIGYSQLFINITAPNSVANIVATKPDGSTVQYGFSATGESVLTLPNYYTGFLQQRDTVPQYNAPSSNTSFYANRNSVLDFTQGRTVNRLVPEVNAIVLYKGSRLKADSLNYYVMSGVLSNSRWRPL